MADFRQGNLDLGAGKKIIFGDGTEQISAVTDYYTTGEVDTISGALNTDIDTNTSDISTNTADIAINIANIATLSGSAIDNHSELNELDYASAGHTGFASTAALTTTSGVLNDKIINSAGTAITYYLHEELVPEPADHETLSPVPSDDAEHYDSVTIETASGETELDHYITISGTPGTTEIAPGTWTMILWADIDNINLGPHYINANWYVHEEGGAHRPLFTQTAQITSTDPTRYVIETSMSGVAMDVEDRLEVIMTAQVTGTSRTIGYYIEGIDHSTRFLTPVYANLITDHSDLASLAYADAGHTGFQPTGDYATNTALSTLDTKVDTTSGTLQGQVTTNAGDISTNTSDISDNTTLISTTSGTLQANIDTNTGDISTNVGDISDLDTKIDTTSGTLQGEIDGLSNDHSALDELDYASAGHTGFSSEAELTSTSGALQTNIDAIPLNKIELEVTNRSASVECVTSTGGKAADTRFYSGDDEEVMRITGLEAGVIVVGISEDGLRDVFEPDDVTEWQDTTFRVIVDGEGIEPGMAIINYQDVSKYPLDGSGLFFARAYGDVDTPAAVGDEEGVGIIRFIAHDGTGFEQTALIRCIMEAEASENVIPSRLNFYTTETDDPEDNDPRLSIRADGKVELGTGTGINEFSTDDTLAGDSDDAVPTEQAVKAYVDATISGSVVTDHSALDELDYASAGHTGFQPAGDYATNTDLATVSGLGDTNTSDISTNASDIGDNTTLIGTTSGTLQADIDTNASDISDNTNDIATNTSDIATVSGSIVTEHSGLSELDYASAGHTGFAQSYKIVATDNASNYMECEAGANDIIITNSETFIKLEDDYLILGGVGDNDIVINGDDDYIQFSIDNSVKLYIQTSGLILEQGNLRLNRAASGVDHTSSGLTTRLTVGENVVYGNLLYMKSDGKLWKADASDDTKMPVMAMAISTVSNNNEEDVLLQGFALDESWSWTVGGTIYASETTGAITQTVPSGTGNMVQVLGVAGKDSDLIYFNPSQGMVEVA